MADGHKIRNQNGLHFLTLKIIGSIDLFTSAECRQIVIDNLCFCQKYKGLVIYAYVIMSNHIHLICATKEGYFLSDTIRDFKSYTAKTMIQQLQDSKDKRNIWLTHLFKYFANFNKRNSNLQIWDQNNHPIELESPAFINQKLDYIHMNPVRARIVNLPEQYVFSSALNYIEQEGVLKVEILDLTNEIGYIST